MRQNHGRVETRESHRFRRHIRPVSTYSGRSGLRSWTPQLGGNLPFATNGFGDFRPIIRTGELLEISVSNFWSGAIAVVVARLRPDSIMGLIWPMAGSS